MGEESIVKKRTARAYVSFENLCSNQFDAIWGFQNNKQPNYITCTSVACHESNQMCTHSTITIRSTLIALFDYVKNCIQILLSKSIILFVAMDMN